MINSCYVEINWVYVYTTAWAKVNVVLTRKKFEPNILKNFLDITKHYI